MEALQPQEEARLEELCRYAFVCARSNDTGDLGILLRSGLNPNLTNSEGNSLLMIASYNGNLETSRLLLEHGASVDRPNDKGLTPLAGVCFKGYLPIAELLLSYGADPQGRQARGLSPLNCAFLFARRPFIELFARHSKPKAWQRALAWLYGLKDTKPPLYAR